MVGMLFLFIRAIGRYERTRSNLASLFLFH